MVCVAEIVNVNVTVVTRNSVLKIGMRCTAGYVSVVSVSVIMSVIVHAVVT